MKGVNQQSEENWSRDHPAGDDDGDNDDGDNDDDDDDAGGAIL